MSQVKIIMFNSYTKKSIMSREKIEQNVFLVRHLTCSELQFISEGSREHNLFFKFLKAKGLHFVCSSPMTCLQKPFDEIHDISSARKSCAYFWLHHVRVKLGDVSSLATLP